MYYKMIVLVEEDTLKNHLMEQGMSDDEVENLDMDDLQDEAREAVNGILSDWFNDYQVFDKNSIIFGDMEVYEPSPKSLDYILE